MLANIKNMFLYFGAHYNDILLAVVIMVSSVIVAIGLLKPLAFNKIKNKYIRKAALAFSNVLGCFVSAFVYFLTEGWNLDYYLLAALALSAVCIVTYWFYENTCLRNLIELVGSLALRKTLSLAHLALTTDDVKTVEAEYNNAKAQLKASTKTELKKTTLTKTNTDKDLRGL